MASSDLDVGAVLRDPDFIGLSTIEKRKFLLDVDPDFSGLPVEEQSKFIISLGGAAAGSIPPPEKSTLRKVAEAPVIAAAGLGQALLDIPEMAYEIAGAAARPPETTGEKAAMALGPLGVPLKRLVLDPMQATAEAARQKTGAKRAALAAASGIPVLGPMVAGVGESIQKPSDILFAAGRGVGWWLTGKYAGPAAEWYKEWRLGRMSKNAIAGLKDIDNALAAPPTKAEAMTRDIKTAGSDLKQIVVKEPLETKGAERLHELAEKIRTRQDALWEEGHRAQIQRNPNLIVEHGAIADAARAAISKVNEPTLSPQPMAQRTASAEAKSALKWIDDAVDQPMNLLDLDEFVRYVNSDLRNFESVKAYGNLGTAARIAAVKAARLEIERALTNVGETGVKELNRRWGALDNIREQVERRAVSEARAEAGKSGIPEWAHLYSFVHPGASMIPLSVGVGLQVSRMLRPAKGADLLVKGLRKLAKSDLPEPTMPAVPARPPTRGLLPSAPLVTEPPADTSFVRGVRGQVEQVPSRQLTAGEGVGPLNMPPSPLSPAAGSEPTPTGGARGYLSSPQPREGVLPSAPPTVIEARRVTVRNPRTGRMERVYMPGEPTTEAHFQQVAQSAGARFDGFWEDGDIALTDPVTRSSLKIKPEQMTVGAVKSKLAQARAKFKKARAK